MNGSITYPGYKPNPPRGDEVTQEDVIKIFHFVGMLARMKEKNEKRKESVSREPK